MGYVIFKTNTPTHQPFLMCFQHVISEVVHFSGGQPSYAALYFHKHHATVSLSILFKSQKGGQSSKCRNSTSHFEASCAQERWRTGSGSLTDLPAPAFCLMLLTDGRSAPPAPCAARSIPRTRLPGMRCCSRSRDPRAWWCG